MDCWLSCWFPGGASGANFDFVCTTFERPLRISCDVRSLSYGESCEVLAESRAASIDKVMRFSFFFHCDMYQGEEIGSSDIVGQITVV